MWKTPLCWEQFNNQLLYQRWSFPVIDEMEDRMKNDVVEGVYLLGIVFFPLYFFF